jgi:hypothetical protein
MSVLAIVLIVLAVLLLLLFAGGYVANRRRYEAEDAEVRRQIREADLALATAHAEDKGWDRPIMEAAAQHALARPGEPLELVAVIDNPGTDADEAVFRAADGTTVRLGRRNGQWTAV